jgi:hypothetical protein
VGGVKRFSISRIVFHQLVAHQALTARQVGTVQDCNAKYGRTGQRGEKIVGDGCFGCRENPFVEIISIRIAKIASL